MNNSSANEAAQALKMAAARMQSEGVNPASLLQLKGSSDNSDLLKRIDEWSSAFHSTNDKLQRALAEIENLKRREASASSKGANDSELRKVRADLSTAQYALREAKEAAVKWYKRAETAEKELTKVSDNSKDLEIALESASRYQKAFVNAESKYEKASKIGRWSLAAAGVLLVGVVVLNDANNDLKYSTSHTDVLATCTGNSKKQNLKFWFKNGVVTSFVNGKYEGVDNEPNRDDFLNNVYHAFQNVNCKIGVNE